MADKRSIIKKLRKVDMTCSIDVKQLGVDENVEMTLTPVSSYFHFLLHMLIITLVSSRTTSSSLIRRLQWDQLVKFRYVSLSQPSFYFWKLFRSLSRTKGWFAHQHRTSATTYTSTPCEQSSPLPITETLQFEWNLWHQRAICPRWSRDSSASHPNTQPPWNARTLHLSHITQRFVA